MEKPAFLIAVSKAGNGGTSAPPPAAGAGRLRKSAALTPSTWARLSTISILAGLCSHPRNSGRGTDSFPIVLRHHCVSVRLTRVPRQSENRRALSGSPSMRASSAMKPASIASPTAGDRRASRRRPLRSLVQTDSARTESGRPSRDPPDNPGGSAPPDASA